MSDKLASLSVIISLPITERETTPRSLFLLIIGQPEDDELDDELD